MYWYLIVLRNGKHFFATRHYFEKSFIMSLAKQLHKLLPDATIKLYYGVETSTETILYKGDNNE